MPSKHGNAVLTRMDLPRWANASNDKVYWYRALQIILIKSGRVLLEFSPYVVLGVVASQALRYTKLTAVVKRACAGAPFVSVLLAAVLGLVSPLCTYGTVPVVLQLYRAGVPLAPLVTFLSASSLMNPQLFILTWGGISPEMALIRFFAVLIFAVVLGVVVHRLPARWITNPAVLERPEPAGCEVPAKRFEWRRFLRECYDNTLYIGYYLVIGILLGAAVEVYVPGRWIAAAFRPGQWTSVALAAVLGVPLYACGGGTIPLIRSLITRGMSQGAALAFFISGPATRITPLLALAAILKPRFIAVYVFVLLAYSLTAGVLYGR